MNLGDKSLFNHFLHSKINSKNAWLSWVMFLSKSIQCLHGSFKINSVNSCHTKQRAVLEGVRCKGVISSIPQTATADLYALPSELADVDQDNNLISGNHEVLHTGFYHLDMGNSKEWHSENWIIQRTLHKSNLFTSHIVFVIFWDHSTSYFSSCR